MTIKDALKTVTPRWALAARDQHRANRATRRFAGMPTPDVFGSIYSEGLWGRRADGDLTSGRGSHDEIIVGPYVAAMREFLQGFPTPPDAVDLGCGDFNVGSQLRDTCGAYIACDVVSIVIERNRTRFADIDVDFRALDMIQDPLPPGDVVFIRQVLQHLSNAQIAQILPKLDRYQWAVISEHVPGDDDFVPNLDMVAGPATRFVVRSGVVLEQPPFALTYVERRELAVVRHDEGTIRTTAYRFA